MARLFSDVFTDDPAIANNFRSGYRFKAACAAALVGSGRETDSAQLAEPERARWRQQARQWLSEDVTARTKALAHDPNTSVETLRTIKWWRGNPDLVGLFEPSELAKMPTAERDDGAALSKEIGTLLARVFDVASAAVRDGRLNPLARVDRSDD
jgi:hypothetical protein